MLKASLRKFLLEELEDFFGERGGARGEAAEEAEIVVVDYWVADETDQDWGYEQEFSEAVFDDGVEHGFHCKGWEHDDFGVDEGWKVEGVDETGDVKGWEDGEDSFEVGRCDLLDLEALCYHVLMCNHDLGACQPRLV